MKTLLALLIIIASFGCSNQKKTDPVFTLLDYPIDEPTSYHEKYDGFLKVNGDSTNSSVEFTAIEVEGAVKGVALPMYFNHGDTLVLDENTPGGCRVKRPDEVIGEYVYLGTVTKIDSGYQK